MILLDTFKSSFFLYFIFCLTVVLTLEKRVYPESLHFLYWPIILVFFFLTFSVFGSSCRSACYQSSCIKKRKKQSHSDSLNSSLFSRAARPHGSLFTTKMYGPHAYTPRYGLRSLDSDGSSTSLNEEDLMTDSPWPPRNAPCFDLLNSFMERCCLLSFFNQSVNILFYVCLHWGDIRPPPKFFFYLLHFVLFQSISQYFILCRFTLRWY